jgi:hypothetical protein
MPWKIQPSPSRWLALSSRALLLCFRSLFLRLRGSFARATASLLGFPRCFRTIAGHVELHDHAVMHQPINRRRRGHRILEDRLPAREWQVARQQDAATLVTLRQQQEQHLHLLPALLNIAQVVHDQRFPTRHLLEHLGESQVPLRRQQLLHQKTALAEQHLPPTAHQFLPKRT